MDVEGEKTKNRILVSIIPTETEQGFLEQTSQPRLSFTRTPKGFFSQSLTPSNQTSGSSNNLSQISISPSNHQVSPQNLNKSDLFQRGSMKKRTTVAMLNSLPHNKNSKTQKSVQFNPHNPTIDLSDIDHKDNDDAFGTPRIMKEYRYRNSEHSNLSNNSTPQKGGQATFSFTSISDCHDLTPPRKALRPSLKSQTTKYSTPKQSKLRNPKKFYTSKTQYMAPISKFNQSGLGLDIESSSDEEEKLLTDKQMKTRKKMRKALHVLYFIGIMQTLRNKVKIYGALRPVEYFNNFKSEAEAEQTVPKKTGILPLSPTSTFSLLWAFFTVFLLILTAITTPLYVSFAPDDDPFFYYLNLLFDICFGIDIVINFITAYYDSKNRLVTDFYKITMSYLQGWFWIDIIAILPFDMMFYGMTHNDDTTTVTVDNSNPKNPVQKSVTSKVNKLLRLLRFPRLYRMLKILRLMKMLNLFSQSPLISNIIKKINLNVALTKLFRLMISFFFLNHMVACLWFFLAKMEDLNPDTWVGQSGLTDESARVQYIASLYWAFETLTTVGYGDFAPGTEIERLIYTFWPAVCMFVDSYLVGSLISILSKFDNRAEVFQTQMDGFNRFALQANLPPYLKQKIQRFFELNHKENMVHYVDPNDNLKSLPASLKTSVLLYSYYSLIKSVSILHINTVFTASLIPHFKLLTLHKDEILFREDDYASEVFFISSGAIKFVTQNKKQIFSLGRGTYFGEIEIFDSFPQRYCFSQAKQETLLLICHKDAFLKSLKEFPKIETQMKKTSEIRRQKIIDEYTAAQQDFGTEQGIIYKTTDYVNKLLLHKPSKRSIENITTKRTTQSSRSVLTSTSRPDLTKITEESEKAEKGSAGIYPYRSKPLSERLPTDSDPPLLQIKEEEDLFPKESLMHSNLYNHHHNIHKDLTERDSSDTNRFEYPSSLRLLNKQDSRLTIDQSKVRDEKSLTFEPTVSQGYNLENIDLLNITRRPSAVNLMTPTDRGEKKDSFYFEKSIELQREESNLAFTASPNETPKSLLDHPKNTTPKRVTNRKNSSLFQNNLLASVYAIKNQKESAENTETGSVNSLMRSDSIDFKESERKTKLRKGSSSYLKHK